MDVLLPGQISLSLTHCSLPLQIYFPYLRGRQFELIALRELVEKGVLSSRITPIIEPVKLSSTLVIDEYISEYAYELGEQLYFSRCITIIKAVHNL